MADWDADSPELLRNLLALGRKVSSDATARKPVSSQAIRQWQLLIMKGLVPTDGEPIGMYRGEPGLDDYNVEIGSHLGVDAAQVAAELAGFDRTLMQRLGELDSSIRRAHLDADLTADNVQAVLILCAWAHGEWVRIHPFPNGNGRTARILVNSVAQRYGLPAFMRMRPRPGVRYEWVASQAMVGHWHSAISLFAELYEAALDE